MERIHDSEVGICPHCGGTDIDYSDMVMDGGGVYLPAECENCGKTFQEWYNLEFDAQYVNNTQEDK